MNIEFMKSKKFMVVLSFLGLYFISTGASLAVFSYLVGDPSINVASSGDVNTVRTRIDVSQPKTEECPMNGAMFTKAEKAIWEGRRPLVAMIENHADSRPPSGLSKADIIYEAVAEGGITRFMAIFYCNVAATEVKIAPVRSARIYFIDWASEYGTKPIFMHVGGANNFSGSGDTAKEVRALEYLETLGWRVPKGNDFDTTYDSGYPVFWRNYERLDREVATEHTMMVSIDAAYAEAEKRGLTSKDAKGVPWDKGYTPWKFADGKTISSPKASQIAFSFWKGKPDYDVQWKYDPTNNVYLRSTGGQVHIDLENKEQLSTSNIVIIFTQEKDSIDKNLHTYYKTVGTGDALIFQNGDVISGTWQKTDRTSRTIFKDSKGKEITFARGRTFIEVLSIGTKVDYN
jgi:hypothetical protein